MASMMAAMSVML
jgi:hypothetical protein